MGGLNRSVAPLIEGRPDVTGDVVALTFDDGPAVWTEPILDTLRDAGVRATFFVIGAAIPGLEATLARTIAEGHQVGNHTLTHPWLDEVETRAEIERELELASRAIESLTGTAPAVFRPPGFRWSSAVLAAAGACGSAGSSRRPSGRRTTSSSRLTRHYLPLAVAEPLLRPAGSAQERGQTRE
jgi:peptidoglycan/xylan/chitin deacetylase (PgdA/CDA1 family)